MTGRRLKGASDQLVAGAVVGSVAVVAAGSLAQLVGYALHLGGVLDSAEDGGAFGVVGDVAAGGAAAAAWLVLVRVRPVRPSAVVLPPLLTFIAVDKVVRLHDHIPHYMVFYAPVLLVALACLVDLARRMPPLLGRLVGIGLGLLAVSFGLHVVGDRLLGLLGVADIGWAWQVKAVVKHGCEVLGWGLVAIGLAFQAIRRLPSRSLGER